VVQQMQQRSQYDHIPKPSEADDDGLQGSTERRSSRLRLAGFCVPVTRHSR
jgi:hypothetical protein